MNQRYLIVILLLSLVQVQCRVAIAESILQAPERVGEILNALYNQKESFNDIVNRYSGALANLISAVPGRPRFALRPLADALRAKAGIDGPGNAQVRFGTTLGPQEEQFREKRLEVVRNYLNNFPETPLFTYGECADPAVELRNNKPYFNLQQIGDVPIVGVSASGGGVRAMISMLGAYEAMAETGILPAVTYAAVLSGGSWGTLPWTMSADYSPTIQKEFLKENLTKGNDPIKQPIISPRMQSDMRSHLLKKMLSDEPITFVDFYGYLISRSILSLDNRQQFSKPLDESISDLFTTGERLLPIGTAIIGEQRLSDGTYPWFEVTPFEAGSFDMATWVPAPTFGHKFEDGASIQRGPMPYLGYLLGIFGSAFAISAEYMREEMDPHPLLKKLLPVAAKKEGIDKRRWLAAKVNNPGYGPQSEATLFNDQPTLKLSDGGLAFNNPLVPLVGNQRGVNVIIVLDASASVSAPITEDSPGEFGKAMNYFKQRNISFPVTEVFEIEASNVNPFSVFKSGELAIIYIPLPCPEGMENTCDTFNFTYSAAEVERLANAAKERVRGASCAIMRAMQDMSTFAEIVES